MQEIEKSRKSEKVGNQKEQESRKKWEIINIGKSDKVESQKKYEKRKGKTSLKKIGS